MRLTRPDIDDVDVESFLANLDRLREVRASGFLGSPRSDRLDALARTAARQLGTPMAFMSILDDREEFHTASHQRSDLAELPRSGPASASFCQFVVATDGVFAVNDALVDPLVEGLPAVTAGQVRSYLGVPIRRNGQVLGSFCVADVEPRQWTDEDVAALERVADGVDAGGG
jgi:GAF domain-containing protein